MTRLFTRDDSPVHDFELLPLLRYVVGGLLFQEAARGHDPHDSADVEELFTLVKMLYERHESPLNPFVSSWAPLLEQLAEPQLPINRGHLVAVMQAQRAADHRFGRFVDLEDVATGIEAGHATTQMNNLGPLQQALLVGLRAMAKTPSRKTAYLQKLVAHAHSRSSPVATLNYDVTLEQAARRHGVSYEYGVEGWTESGRIAFPTGSLMVLKLHGSVNWQRVDREDEPDEPPRPHLITNGRLGRLTPPWVIFGQGNKLQPDGPFLSLYMTYRQMLEVADHLTVVGYSFRDDHVNRLIVDWMHGDSGRALRIVDPDFAHTEIWTRNFSLRTLSAWRDRIEVIALGTRAWLGDTRNLDPA